jgi:APA family basic amino acid/polyamine antiporter
MVETTREGLVRVIRKWDLSAVVINSIIGAGIFGLPATAFALVGVYSLVAFLLCGLLVTLIIVCFAEVSSRYTDTGGPYLYAREAFGPVVGFEVGWLIWVSRVTAFAANCNLLIEYLGFFVPSVAVGGLRAVVIAAIVAGLTAVNVIGVRDATRVTNVLTIAKLLPLLLFVAVGVFFIDAGSYTPTAAPTLGNLSVSVLLLVYAFTGFEMAAIPSGEACDPRRDLPWALLTSIAAVTVFYLLIQLVSVGTLPTLAESTRPLADAGARFLGPMGAALISAGAVVSILGNLNVTLMVTPRLPFAMAERNELPKLLAHVHARFRTPDVAIYASAVITLVLTLTGTFIYAATISVIARLLAYAATCAALPVLRRRTGPEAAFVAPFGVAASVVSLCLVGWLLTNTTGPQARDTLIAAACGLLIYVVSRQGARDDAT